MGLRRRKEALNELFRGSCVCGAVGRLSVRLPGASGKNPLIGVEQATGWAGGPD